MRDFIRLFKFVKPHLGVFALAVAFMLISAVFDGAQIAPAIPMIDNVFTGNGILIDRPLPDFLSRIIETINAMPRLTLLKFIVMGFLGLFVFKGVTIFARQYLMTNVGHMIVRDVRNALYAKYQSLSLDYYSKSKVGALVSRITYDVGVINNSIAQGLTDVFYQTFKIVILLGIAIFINWRLFLISIVLFPFISIPIVRISKALRALSAKSQEKMGEVTSTLYEGLSGIRIVKTFLMEQYEVDKFANANQGFYKFAMKSAKRIIAISPLTEFVGAMAAMFVLYVGGSQVIEGTLSFGLFAAFMGSMFQCVQPFKRLSNINAVVQQASAAATRIFEILDTPSDLQDKPGAIDLPEFKDKIKLEDVNFKYSGEENPVLKDIDLEVPKGTALAIVGPSGVGKTTLVNLIGRFYDVTGGRITIDGHDVRDITLKSLRQKIGIVTQDMFLFNDTVKANIAYGNIEASEDAIFRAAQAAGAHEFVQNLPKGYDTIIGDRGFRLSGGEKQRLAIARALLKNPPILILDEATSQLDSQSEILVQKALEELMRGRTVFVIAHRLSTVRNASKIIVLDEKRIVESGTHDELMAGAGLYKELYQLQFRDAVVSLKKG
ncbi:MAG: ATP-binding cassette domain-containing protein [Candidatus Omnitrophica bacterium]|nr:ATP-binding cassette domain-containing protein [Candidatus Omnitrophota bacterium]